MQDKNEIGDFSPGMGAHRQSISLVFPAYNEEANIVQAVAQAQEVLGKYFSAIQIIVVDDGSTDRTGNIIDELAKAYPEVVPLHHSVNKGYGAALTTGIYSAEHDLIFFTDSDLQFDLAEIFGFVDWINEYDIVVGYRVRRADPLYRRLNAFAWGTLVRLLLGVKVRDLDCAFKLFNRRVFETIKIRSNGALVSAEILALAGRHGFTIKELPVTHRPRIEGEQTGANPLVIMKAFKELFAMCGELRR
jgi:glycosyltransferase involved in cell wall biosynthesis